MTCSYHEMIDAYLDDQLDDKARASFERHMSTCDACRENVALQQALIQSLDTMPMVALPEGFNEELQAKLKTANPQVKQAPKWYQKLNKRGLASLAVACLVIAVVGTGALKGLFDNLSQRMESTYSADGAAPQVENHAASPADNTITFNESNDSNLSSKMAEPSVELSDSTSVDSNLQDRKLIKNGSINLEVVDYQAVYDQILTMVDSHGGYIQNSQTEVYSSYDQNDKAKQFKYGSITMRIAYDQFDAVYSELMAFEKVTNQSQNIQDITTQYRDTINEVKNLEVREEVLRKIMENAQSVSDVIEVERELSEVRANINNFQQNLQRWDRLVEMSTIVVQIKEVADPTLKVEPIDETLLARAKQAFVTSTNRLVDGAELLFVNMVGLLPFMLPLALLLVIAYLIYKHRRNKNE